MDNVVWLVAIVAIGSSTFLAGQAEAGHRTREELMSFAPAIGPNGRLEIEKGRSPFETSLAIDGGGWADPELPRLTRSKRATRRGETHENLTSMLRRLAARKQETSSRSPMRTLGDVLLRFHEVRKKYAAHEDDPHERRKLMSEREELLEDLAFPLSARERGIVRGLVFDDYVYRAQWDPTTELGKFVQNDGIVFEVNPWKQTGPGGTRDVFEGAVVIFAPLSTIKARERDFASYPVTQAGVEWLSIDPEIQVWSPENKTMFLEVFMHVAIPRLNTSLAYNLHILDREDDGYLVTDYYATDATTGLRATRDSASERFKWLCGRDSYIPVHDGRGAFVAVIMSSMLTFSLESYDVGESDAVEAMRTAMGNMKRSAEAIR